MIENFIVERRSAGEIECLAYDWRRTLDIQDQWAPDLLDILQNKLPNLFPGFEFVPQSSEQLPHAEAFTRHPRIFARTTVIEGARAWNGRDRFTLSHELGHLFMHPDAPSPRMVAGNRAAPIDDFRRSAEWQASKFASFFLLPEYIVRQFSSAEELAKHCKTSYEAASHRFKQVGHFKEPLSPTFVAFLNDWKKKHT